AIVLRFVDVAIANGKERETHITGRVGNVSDEPAAECVSSAIAHVRDSGTLLQGVQSTGKISKREKTSVSAGDYITALGRRAPALGHFQDRPGQWKEGELPRFAGLDRPLWQDDRVVGNPRPFEL